MSNTKKVHTWRLRKVMADRDIWTAIELHRRLTAYGLELSSAHVSRIIQERPQRINTDLLDALVSVLDCDISDILKAEVVTEDGNAPAPKPEKTKRELKSDQPAKGKVTILPRLGRQRPAGSGLSTRLPCKGWWVRR
jgi:DNA-binding Xre family transcriptional regulator